MNDNKENRDQSNRKKRLNDLNKLYSYDSDVKIDLSPYRSVTNRKNCMKLIRSQRT